MHLISRTLLGIAVASLPVMLVSCETTGAGSGSIDTASQMVSSPNKTRSVSSHRVKDRRVVRTTAYYHGEADHLKYGKKSAYGTPLRYSKKVRSAAADWSRYPVGTVFRVKGLPWYYIIDDYGSALVGKDTIDLYKRTRNEMNWWGVRHVQIEVLRWGSYDLSYKILADRARHPHCRKMAEAIRRKKPSVVRVASSGS